MRPRAQAASGVADPTASITLAKNYDPYGSVIESIGNFTTDYGYADEQMDSSGLVNLRARSYDPSTGRFISQDTWEGDVQNPISLNKWVYVNGNPINYTDPSGKCLLEFDAANPASMQNINNCIQSTTRTITAYLHGERRIGVLISDAIGLTDIIYNFHKTIDRQNYNMNVLSNITCSTSNEKISAALDLAVFSLTTAFTIEAILSVGKLALTPTTTGVSSESVWSLKPLERGVKIENEIGRSPDLSQNFPVIDKWENGTATSIKSIDLNAKSYQNINYLESKVTSYITKLSKWEGTEWAGMNIEQSKILSRELVLAIPPDATPAQLAALSGLKAIAKDLGVILNTVIVQ